MLIIGCDFHTRYQACGPLNSLLLHGPPSDDRPTTAPTRRNEKYEGAPPLRGCLFERVGYSALLGRGSLPLPSSQKRSWGLRALGR